MNKFLQKLAKIFLGLSMAAGVGVVVANNKVATSVYANPTGAITSYSNITNGDYYIGCTQSNNDYYLKLAATTAGNRAGTGDTQANATVFTITRSGTTITLKVGSLFVTTSSTNGSLQLQTTSATWTASNESNLIKFSANSKFIAKNTSANKFGTYAGGTLIWLLPASSGDPEINVESSFTSYKDVKKAFTFSFSNLTNNISITQASTGSTSGEVSLCLTENGTYTSSLTVNKTDSSPKTIYVKGVTNGTANLIFTSSGATTKTCSVTISDPAAYSTGFESGFTTDTNYQQTTTTGPSGFQWKTYNGTPSTSAPLVNGSVSMQMRKYSGTSGNPYTQMEFDIENGHSIKFLAKCSNASGFGVEVFYSTDSGSTYTSLLTQSIGNTNTEVVAAISTWVAQARFKIAFTGSNPGSSHRDLSIDDVEIYTQSKPTTPTISITSKDGNGEQNGVLGATSEVTIEKDNDTGLTVHWDVTDTESTISWNSETHYITYLSYNVVYASIMVSLQDSQNNIVASDEINVKVLQPSVMIRYGGQDRAKLDVYPGDTGTLTSDVTNMPVGATASLEWTSTDTNNDYIDFNNGAFEVKEYTDSKVTVSVNVKYGGNTVATDSLQFTIKELTDPTLCISAGTGKTSYVFGEELDLEGWEAIYTNNKGVQSVVTDDTTFGSIEFIGKKGIKGTYSNLTSTNSVEVTVTNEGATSDTETILSASSFLSGSMPKDWTSSGQGSNYAESHGAYRLKMDSTGDKITAAVNTSASTIYAELGIKLASGATTCSFNVTAKDSLGNSVATGVLEFSGANNEILSESTELSNPSGETVTSIEFSFVKGTSNVGVGKGSISINNSAAFAQKQVLAYARYFLEQTEGYCTNSISSTVITSLKNEFNWMISESIKLFKDAPIRRGSGASYPDDVSQALSRYINMLEDKGYSDVDFLNLGDEVIHKSSGFNFIDLAKTNTVAIIVIISMVSMTAIGGYFFIRKRKENI